MEKFNNKYRIQSARWQKWEYSSAGLYFITICTKNRKFYFGEIINGEMILSRMGIAAREEWMKTPEIRSDMNLELGEFVVMPDHFHAIIMIGHNQFNTSLDGNDNLADQCYADDHGDHGGGGDDRGGGGDDHGGGGDDRGRDALHGVSTIGHTIINGRSNKFGPQSKNLSSIVRGFKSSVTTFARKNNIEFNWQERFHDRVIRNQDAYRRISDYIINNPANWKRKNSR